VRKRPKMQTPKGGRGCLLASSRDWGRVSKNTGQPKHIAAAADRYPVGPDSEDTPAFIFELRVSGAKTCLWAVLACFHTNPAAQQESGSFF
jgi:hypothetical protein